MFFPLLYPGIIYLFVYRSVCLVSKVSLEYSGFNLSLVKSYTFQRTGSSRVMFSLMSSSMLKVLMTELILNATL